MNRLAQPIQRAPARAPDAKVPSTSLPQARLKQTFSNRHKRFVGKSGEKREFRKSGSSTTTWTDAAGFTAISADASGNKTVVTRNLFAGETTVTRTGSASATTTNASSISSVTRVNRRGQPIVQIDEPGSASPRVKVTTYSGGRVDVHKTRARSRNRQVDLGLREAGLLTLGRRLSLEAKMLLDRRLLLKSLHDALVLIRDASRNGLNDRAEDIANAFENFPFVLMPDAPETGRNQEELEALYLEPLFGRQPDLRTRFKYLTGDH